MRIIVSLLLFTLAYLPLCVSAEAFNLSNQERLYACNSKENIEQMLKAATADNYFIAAASVVNYEENACPSKGPFNDDRLYASVVTDERGQLGNSYDRITIVEWQFKGSNRSYYSLIVRSNFGIWHDAIDTIMEIRTVNGIVDFFSN